MAESVEMMLGRLLERTEHVNFSLADINTLLRERALNDKERDAKLDILSSEVDDLRAFSLTAKPAIEMIYTIRERWKGMALLIVLTVTVVPPVFWAIITVFGDTIITWLGAQK